MEVKTLRGEILNVATRFRKMYGNNKGIPSKLERLDLSRATVADVAAVIGNESWTNLWCNECGKHDCEAVVQLGDEPDYDSATATVCLPCLRAALEAVEKETRK